MYETDIHNIYNMIVGQANGQLQEKAALDVTFQAAKTGQETIGYLMILKKFCFLKQSEQNLSGLHDWRPGDCTTTCITQTVLRKINWSGSRMHRRSKTYAMGASYKGYSSNTE